MQYFFKSPHEFCTSTRPQFRLPRRRGLRLVCFATAVLNVMLSNPLASADERKIPLWPEGIPGLHRELGPERHDGGIVGNVSNPTLTYCPPTGGEPTGTAVIICPGGGYLNLSFDWEGYQYAHWLGRRGIASFILKYRLTEFGHPAPLQDVLRAVRIVRTRAAEFRVSPARIGVMGSSAGGHLAACAGTLFDHPAGQTGAALDAVSARPDFLILMYPVITMDDPLAHAGSREALIGAHPSRELVDLLSVERRINGATPPTLLVHTQEDAVVSVDNSILFYQALTRAGVPAELYLFARGKHGIGLTGGLGTAADLPQFLEAWLCRQGLLTPLLHNASH